ncbi:RpoL/Rpb11 RNA polymerase subunit family protein [[Eubacterium] cellulosolvens]
MRIKTIKKTKDELKLEIEGESHTFCNLLQNTLVEDRSVKIAGYDTPHPLTEKSIIYIKVKKDGTPKKVLERALKKINQRTDEFLSEFIKVIGKK